MAEPSIVFGQAPQGWARVPTRTWTFIRRWPVIPILILSSLAITAIFAPLIAPKSPLEQSLRDRRVGPVWTEGGSTKFLLGTDHVGRDILSRIIHGSRISLMVAAVALTSGILIGSTLGLVAGWYGGIADEIVARNASVSPGPQCSKFWTQSMLNWPEPRAYLPSV